MSSFAACRHLIGPIWCSVIVALSACAADAGEIQELKIGLDGQGKVGCWLPVTVRASGLPPAESVELEVAFPDPRGDLCRETAASGRVSAEGSVELMGYFRSGRLEGSGTVAVVAGNETLCSTAVNFGENLVPDEEGVLVQRNLVLRKQNTLALITIGKVEGIPELVRNIAGYSGGHELLYNYKLDSVAQLPKHALGLNSVDKLLLLDDFSLGQDQSEALIRWVRDGGELYIGTGGTVSEFLATPVGAWTHAHFELAEAPIQMGSFSTLEAFVPGASRIETRLRGRDSWPVAAARSDQSIVLVNSLDGPIISRQSIGSGIVTLVGVDLNQAPFIDWTSPSLPMFYEVLLFGAKLDSHGLRRSTTSRISQSGVSDLATQLVTTVDASPENGRWSAWSVMAMIIVWLLLIGPLDYLIVTRLLKRPELTWISFPVMIVAGAAVLYVVSGQSESLQLQQLDVVDISEDDDQQHVTARTWMSISSPETRRSDCAATPVFLNEPAGAVDITLSWNGRPEDVFGAMYRHSGIGLGQQSYRHHAEQPARLSQVPLLTNGSRALESVWHTVSQEELLSSNLSVSGFGLLNGSFTHNLPEPVRRWIVVYGNRVYRPESADDAVLAPGQVWDSDSTQVATSDLKGYLNASRIVQTDDGDARNKSGFAKQRSTQVISPYNTRSLDEIYILTMISFYQFAGGAEYAGLSHSQLRQMELSDTIRLNHAVLIGHIDQPASSLSVDGEEVTPASRATLVRLFLPVNRRPASEDSGSPDNVAAPGGDDIN